MAKESKKKEVVEKKEGPICFHKLKDEERQQVIFRMSKGEVVLRGPDSHVVEVKH
jgi:hypothetical protein